MIGQGIASRLLATDPKPYRAETAVKMMKMKRAEVVVERSRMRGRRDQGRKCNPGNDVLNPG